LLWLLDGGDGGRDMRMAHGLDGTDWIEMAAVVFQCVNMDSYRYRYSYGFGIAAKDGLRLLEWLMLRIVA
jgi:hypothetical protein